MRLRKRVGAVALSSILVMTSISPAMAEELVSEISEQVVIETEETEGLTLQQKEEQDYETENLAEDDAEKEDIIVDDAGIEILQDNESEYTDEPDSEEVILEPYEITEDSCSTNDLSEYSSETTWTSGEVTVTFADNTLTVSGNGAMMDYSSSDPAPWSNYRYFIQKIVLESGVTYIGQQAFAESSVSVIEFPDSLQEIGQMAFFGCYTLTEITIPGNVKKLDRGSFANCTSLSSVTLSDGIQEMEDYVFQKAIMTTVFIPASVTSIDQLTFFCDEKLTSFEVDATNVQYTSEDGVLFNKNQTKLINYPLGKKATAYQVPDGVQTIGSSAFQENKVLTSITFPNTLQTIEGWAFCRCTSLLSFTIPDSVTTLGKGIWDSCYSLETVVVGNGVTILEYREFSGCASLRKVILGDNLKTIYLRAFYECSSLSEINLPQGLETIRCAAFKNCTSLTHLTIPDSVICIENDVFAGCTNLTIEYLADLEEQEDGSYLKLDHVEVSGTRHYDAAYQILALVNQERAKEGRAPLTMDRDLLEAAMKRAAELSIDFSHTRPNQMSCSTISSKLNGENIAGGYRDAEKIMDMWMNSPGHRDNILATAYQSVGIGCFEQNGSWFWVQDFGWEPADAVDQPQNRSVTESIGYVYNVYSSQFSLDCDAHGDTIDVGDTSQLYVIMTYARINTNHFQWISNNPSIASVNEQGVVTGVADGDAVITASSGKISVSLTIHVQKKSTNNGNGQKDWWYWWMYAGEEEHEWSAWWTEEEPTVFKEGRKGRECERCRILWEEAIPKLEATGSANMSTIKLQVNQKTSALKIIGMAKGDYVKTYKSGNTKIFAVAKSGKLTAKKAGTAKLTATLASGKKITVKVIVQKGKVKTTKVTVNKKSLKLKAGKTETLKVKRYPYTSQEKVTYKSSNSKVVKVSKNGKVTAKKKGAAKITVKSGKKTVTCKVKVY